MGKNSHHKDTTFIFYGVFVFNGTEFHIITIYVLPVHFFQKYETFTISNG